MENVPEVLSLLPRLSTRGTLSTLLILSVCVDERGILSLDICDNLLLLITMIRAV